MTLSLRLRMAWRIRSSTFAQTSPDALDNMNTDYGFGDQLGRDIAGPQKGR
jgi:hypothetical protein